MWNFAIHGQSPALIERSHDNELLTISYDQLDSECLQIAKHAGKRTLAFVFCENTCGAVAGYLAFLKAGIVPALIEASITDALLNPLLDCYHPYLVWIPTHSENRFPEWEKLYEVWGYSLLRTPKVEALKINETSNAHIENLSPYEEFSLYPDLALLVSTSGSTGTPKLVRLSYENIRSNTRSIIEYLGITSTDRAIASLPMNYVYGLSVLHTHLASGASLVLTDAPCYSGEFWNLFEETQCTSFAGVPFMYEMLNKLKFTKQQPPKSLRSMTQAGGHLPRNLQEEFAAYCASNDINFFVMYGASEATARMSWLPPHHALDKAGSIGIAIPEGRLALIDEDGMEISSAHTVGELVYFGDNVCLGYAESVLDLNKGDENNGKLVTGDLAQFDEDGYFFISGRKKRFVKILGKRTNLDDLEELIKREFPDAIGIACAGVDDLIGIFAPDETLGGQIVQFVHDATGINKRMLALRVIDDIPKNSSGKVLYNNLNAMLKQ